MCVKRRRPVIGASLFLGMATTIKTPNNPDFDQVSWDRLNKLHPKVRKEALDLYLKANQALTGRAEVRVVQGLRTFEEQSRLYAQGRTNRNGPVVTQAKAGQSFHNYGLAFDFALLIDGKLISWETGKDFDGDRVADWMEVINIFKAAGWKSGGDFKGKFKDLPHLEKTFGKTWEQLLALHRGKKTDPAGYVIL